jgi:hypothetical protein
MREWFGQLVCVGAVGVEAFQQFLFINTFYAHWILLAG